MANGDAATAAGMDTVVSTDDRRLGYDEINRSRDYLAAHLTAGSHPASAINSGTLAIARIPSIPTTKVTGVLPIAQIPTIPSTKVAGGALTGDWHVSGHLIGDDYIASDDTYGRTLTTSYRSVYTTSVDGKYGYVASTAAVKNLLGHYLPNIEGLLALPLHWYAYKADEAQSPRAGLLAEQLNLVAPELVDHTDGKPDGIKYEMLSVALLGVVQQLAAQVAQLTAATFPQPTQPKKPSATMHRVATKLARAARSN